MSLPPINCTYITLECLQEWKNGNLNFKVSDAVPMLRFLYELCTTTARGELPVQKFKVALDSVKFSDKVSAVEMGSCLADIVTQMAQDAHVMYFCFASLPGHINLGVLPVEWRREEIGWSRSWGNSEKRGREREERKLDRDGVCVMEKYADEQYKMQLTMPAENRARLIKLAKWLVESALVPRRLFQERCEEEFLWESEMIKIKAQDLKSKEVRVNTRLLYQQTKFNLLREESEGYAKLITLLCRDSEASSQSASAVTIGIIKSLIGHFDLDPNRVFDIVLECFELQPNNDIFLGLIPIFPKSHASQILGFKFQYYQRLEVNTPVPFGLYKLTALLVKKDFIDLDSIYAHLLPKDGEAFEHYATFSSKRLDEANKIGRINLAATGKDLMDEENKGDVTIDLLAALDMETAAVAERSAELQNNQTLGLLLGFLSVDDWDHAHLLFDRLSPLNPVAHVDICNGLFRLIEKSISPAYEMVRQINLLNFGLASGANLDTMEATNSSVKKYFIDLPKELFQMLASAGPYFYRDTVCRVLRGYYLSALELLDNSDVPSNPGSGGVGNRVPRLHLKEARLRIEEALGTCILPSLQLIPANPAVCQEIWEVMNLLPYEVRYRLYGEWERDDERTPMVLAARQTAKLDTRRILKRLAKENLKQLGRMVAKLAHANPMTVLRTIVHQVLFYVVTVDMLSVSDVLNGIHNVELVLQIEAYRDMIAPVVDAFKYLTQLEYDVLEYVVIERLAHGGREKLKDDGLNLSDWLQSLASFWGHLCKKYPSMELRGLFQYLVNQLKRGQGIELVHGVKLLPFTNGLSVMFTGVYFPLQELIQQMANVQYTENMTEEQLDAMAGSETLRYQATSFGITRNNKALIKSTNRLRDSLLPKEEPQLAIPLLLLIAQHRSVVVINADAPYIKMVSEQFDRCHGALLQFVEFLGSAVTPATAYAQLIPPLDDLIHLYHLDPEVAFLIYRPVMRLFKSQNISDILWPLDDRGATDISNSEESEPSLYSGNMILDLGSPRKPILWSDLLGTVRTMLPSRAWNSLSPDLYATFWGLTLYDLYVPRNRYEAEIAKQHGALKVLEELSDNSNSAITKRKKDKEKIQESLDRLTNELQKHEENVASVRRRLAREKDNWLSSCPDTLKINMEFLQRCIFPRCTFSMPDAVYCAMFVLTLHSLGTPFFNTVNHIDVLICKALQPMICCCTEYEAGRLGRFLFETLKIAYYWKSDESIYERECGNMPGFAVYYRYPNSQRVTYSQFIKVHWKWSQRITRLLIQCLESTEYMEIRNALIVLTKISGVFPVTRKSGINLEKRVAKIKSDEREDLKVLATGVAAALASRKPSWVTEEEFGMGYLELKPAQPLASKSLTSNAVSVQNGSGPISQIETTGTGGRTQHQESTGTNKDNNLRAKAQDGRLEKPESSSISKLDPPHPKLKGGSLINGSDVQSSVPSAGVSSGMARTVENPKQNDELANKLSDESMSKVVPRTSVEPEVRAAVKRSVAAGSHSKQVKVEHGKDDSRPGKVIGRTSNSTSDRDIPSHPSGGRHAGASSLGTTNGNTVAGKGSSSSTRTTDTHGHELKSESAIKSSDVRSSSGREDVMELSDVPRSSSRPTHSPRDDSSFVTKAGDKQPKRTSPGEEPDRLSKRRRNDSETRDSEGDARLIDRERSMDFRSGEKLQPVDFDKVGIDESRVIDRTLDRAKDKISERYDRDYRERLDRSDKSRGDDIPPEKTRDRSMERYTRERSVERLQERATDRNFDRLTDKAKDERIKDDRNKVRYGEASGEKSHIDDRFHAQSLPPPPPLPPHMVPQSISSGKRDEDAERRFGAARHGQRLSPRHDDKERRRSEENYLVSQDDVKRRREDDFRERKREERESLSMKVDGSSSLSESYELARGKEAMISSVMGVDRDVWIVRKGTLILKTIKQNKMMCHKFTIKEHINEVKPLDRKICLEKDAIRPQNFLWTVVWRALSSLTFYFFYCYYYFFPVVIDKNFCGRLFCPASYLKRLDLLNIFLNAEEREREREREKQNLMKEDMDATAASKKRKLKRDHMPQGEPGEISPAAPLPPSLPMGVSQSYDVRERGDRKGPMVQRAGYLEEPGLRIHGKEAASKMPRREPDPIVLSVLFYMHLYHSIVSFCLDACLLISLSAAFACESKLFLTRLNMVQSFPSVLLECMTESGMMIKDRELRQREGIGSSTGLGYFHPGELTSGSCRSSNYILWGYEIFHVFVGQKDCRVDFFFFLVVADQMKLTTLEPKAAHIQVKLKENARKEDGEIEKIFWSSCMYLSESGKSSGDVAFITIQSMSPKPPIVAIFANVNV
ncbi:THO complex, subunitTHOC2, C-terminal, partial [Dillenia turbinata]